MAMQGVRVGIVVGASVTGRMAVRVAVSVGVLSTCGASSSPPHAERDQEKGKT